jgi:hypothetical protein
MNKILKLLSTTLMTLVLVVNSTVFSYDNFVGNTTISGIINTEKIGILSEDISPTDTSITLESGSTLANGLALIGDELVLVSGGTTITRAQTHTHSAASATTAAAHSKGDSIRNIAQNIDITFTPTTALAVSDSVVITIPNNEPNTFGAMGSVTGSTADTDARTFTVTGLTGTGEQTINISGIEMPELEGQYTIPLEIRSSSSSLIELGSVLVS